MRLEFILAMALCLGAGTATAAAKPSGVVREEIGQIADGYTYYNRPGATLAVHNAELAECVLWTRQPTSENVQSPGLAFQLVWSGPIAGLAAIPVENCMLVRGWRVVRLDATEGEVLSKAPIDVLRSRLEPEIGAAEPKGAFVRLWENQALHPGQYHTASRPRAPSRKQLSMRLYAEMSPAPLPHVPVPTPIKLDPKWPKTALKPEDLAAAPPGSAIIIARVTGISMANGTGVGFARMGATPEDRPSERDLAPDFAVAGAGTLFAKKEGNWFALVVPPGRWRISGSGFVGYCFGSPFFEVAAGDVVYAGTFHLEGPDLTPDLALEPAAAWLGGPRAAELRPAQYRNGARGNCHSVGVSYALEFPDAPFEPGYLWGTAPNR